MFGLWTTLKLYLREQLPIRRKNVFFRRCPHFPSTTPLPPFLATCTTIFFSLSPIYLKQRQEYLLFGSCIDQKKVPIHSGRPEGKHFSSRELFPYIITRAHLEELYTDGLNDKDYLYQLLNPFKKIGVFSINVEFDAVATIRVWRSLFLTVHLFKGQEICQKEIARFHLVFVYHGAMATQGKEAYRWSGCQVGVITRHLFATRAIKADCTRHHQLRDRNAEIVDRNMKHRCARHTFSRW